MKTVRVALGPRSYDIVVGPGLLHSLVEYLPPPHGAGKFAVVTDSNVGPLYADVVVKQLETLGAVTLLSVEAGETSKSWQVAGKLLDDLAAAKVRRPDVLVTLGGGMVSDLGGFVASAYLRGIRVVHLPTTLLGQVDAAIGGKTGVNLAAGKNLAGSFYQPAAVVCDVETLASLPEHEFRSGLAEVIKYGLCFDPAILRYFGEAPGAAIGDADGEPDATPNGSLDPSDPSVLTDMVHRCASTKARVVSGDERDRSGRLILNYGHTFGHALEAVGNFEKWSHGEAISVGMVFAASLAAGMGLIDESLVGVHRRVLGAAGLPVKASFDPAQVADLWQMDKKWDTGQRWVLLEGLGEPVVRSDVGGRHIDRAMTAVLS